MININQEKLLKINLHNIIQRENDTALKLKDIRLLE